MRYEVPQLRGSVKYIEDMERSGFNRGNLTDGREINYLTKV
jgi:hypothetical protein